MKFSFTIHCNIFSDKILSTDAIELHLLILWSLRLDIFAKIELIDKIPKILIKINPIL